MLFRAVTLCKPCLNKKYPLRKQLLLSFLTLAAVSLEREAHPPLELPHDVLFQQSCVPNRDLESSPSRRLISGRYGGLCALGGSTGGDTPKNNYVRASSRILAAFWRWLRIRGGDTGGGGRTSRVFSPGSLRSPLLTRIFFSCSALEICVFLCAVV